MAKKNYYKTVAIGGEKIMRGVSMTNLDHLKKDIIENNTVPSRFYSEYEVKRGLRNQDGSGVLAGLTRISSVVGAKSIDYVRQPVDGQLLYRGVDLFDIAKLNEGNFFFEKVAFLLLVGQLPKDDEFSKFKTMIANERHMPDSIIEHVIKGINSKNIMNKLQSNLSALYSLDEDADSLDPYENFKKAIAILAKLPLMIAYSYLSAFKPDAKFVEPPKEYSQAEAFLYVLNEGKESDKFDIEIMDLCLALHAEHGGGNNSTFTTYVVTSSGTDIYSAITAAIASLKGPLHGSANKKVMDMMDDIKKGVKDWEDKEEVRAYLKKILKGDAHDGSKKIYGLGHAVYTKSDPRATILRDEAKKLAKLKGREKELALYLSIESEGPSVFSELKGAKKVISPNVDFFSGFVYDCLGIPSEIYTPMFAMARIVGWSAHRMEEIMSGHRIIRPGYKYVKTVK